MLVVLINPIIDEGSLSSYENEGIGLFIGFIKLIGLPTSVAEIYRLHIQRKKPQGMDRIMAKPGFSFGALSQGLKVLLSMGSVMRLYARSGRKDQDAADHELNSLAMGFLKEELQLRISQSRERNALMPEYSNGMKVGKRESLEIRLPGLQHWLDPANKGLPWVLRFLAR